MGLPVRWWVPHPGKYPNIHSFIYSVIIYVLRSSNDLSARQTRFLLSGSLYFSGEDKTTVEIGLHKEKLNRFMGEWVPGISFGLGDRSEYQAEAEWPLIKKGIKGASSRGLWNPFHSESTSHITLLANSFTNDYWVTLSQMVDMDEDTLNQALRGTCLRPGVPGTVGWWLPLSPTCHLFAFCLFHRLDCVTAGPGLRA